MIVIAIALIFPFLSKRSQGLFGLYSCFAGWFNGETIFFLPSFFPSCYNFRFFVLLFISIRSHISVEAQRVCFEGGGMGMQDEKEGGGEDTRHSRWFLFSRILAFSHYTGATRCGYGVEAWRY